MKFRSYILLLLLLSVLSVGCKKVSEPSAGARINVMVSIEPMATFVEAIGAERVNVTVMVPRGANPHTYEPKPSQLRAVSRAGLYAKVGSGVEFELMWMDRIVKLNPKMRIVDSSAGIELLRVERDKEHDGHESHEGRSDPHIWTSPVNAIKMVENIYSGLVTLDPEGREVYRANKEAYVKKLKGLDGSIRALLKGKEGTRVIVYHPAWAYFASLYGLEEVSVEHDGKAPTPQGVARLVKMAKEERIRIVFTSPEFSMRAAEVIAREINGEVERISPLKREYIENIERVAEAFSKL